MPYMVPMARAAHGGADKRVVMVCSAQSSKTENLIDLIGARPDQRPEPILYVGPIRDFLTNQFEPRLMCLLNEAEMLSATLPAEGSARRCSPRRHGRRRAKAVALLCDPRLRGARALWLIDRGQLFGPTDDDEVWNAVAT
jgi:hypothetical protein